MGSEDGGDSGHCSQSGEKRGEENAPGDHPVRHAATSRRDLEDDKGVRGMQGGRYPLRGRLDNG